MENLDTNTLIADMTRYQYLTVKNVARYLGVHPRIIQDRIRDHSLRAIRVGKAYRIHPEELKRFVEESAT